MAAQNPFITLGLTQATIEGLRDEDVRRLIKAMFTQLASIYHADSEGKYKDGPARYQAVVEAKDLLAVDQEFYFWQKQLCKNRKDQIVELERALRNEEALARDLRANVDDFWMTFIRSTSYNLPFDAIASAFSMVGWRSITVFQPPQCNILVRSLKQRQYANKYGPTGSGTQVDYEQDKNVIDLKIVDDKTMFSRELEILKFDAKETWRPAVPSDWIFLNTNYPKRSYYFHPKGDYIPLESKLIGSIPAKALDGRERHPTLKRLIDMRDPREIERVDDGFQLGDFEEYLLYVRPVIQMSDLLVVVDDTESDTPIFRFLGFASRILPPAGPV